MKTKKRRTKNKPRDKKQFFGLKETVQPGKTFFLHPPDI